MRYEKFNKLLEEHDLQLGEMSCERVNNKWEYECRINPKNGSIYFRYDDEEYGWTTRDYLTATADTPNKVISILIDKMTSNTIIYEIYSPVNLERKLVWNGEKFVLYDEDGKECSIRIQRNKLFQNLLKLSEPSDSYMTRTGVVYWFEGKPLLEYMKSSKNVWIDEGFYDSVPKNLLAELENEVKLYFGDTKNINKLGITSESHKYNDVVNYFV